MKKRAITLFTALVIVGGSVISNYATPTPSPAAAGQRERGAVAIVSGMSDGYLNLRQRPTTKSKVVDSAYEGDKVVVLSDGGEWAKVRFKGKVGYMVSKFLVYQ